MKNLPLLILITLISLGWLSVGCKTTSERPLRIGLKIIQGDNQSGLVGRCAEKPLVVRAYNLNKPSQSIEGIPLSFEIIQGGGLLLEAKDYSTVTNEKGEAGLHYHFGSRPGINKIRVSVLGDPSVTPVVFGKRK